MFAEINKSTKKHPRWTSRKQSKVECASVLRFFTVSSQWSLYICLTHTCTRVESLKSLSELRCPSYRHSFNVIFITGWRFAEKQWEKEKLRCRNISNARVTVTSITNSLKQHFAKISHIFCLRGEIAESNWRDPQLWMILRLIWHPSLSQRPHNATGGFTKDAGAWSEKEGSKRPPHLVDGGKFA